MACEGGAHVTSATGGGRRVFDVTGPPSPRSYWMRRLCWRGLRGLLGPPAGDEPGGAPRSPGGPAAPTARVGYVLQAWATPSTPLLWNSPPQDSGKEMGPMELPATGEREGNDLWESPPQDARKEIWPVGLPTTGQTGGNGACGTPCHRTKGRKFDQWKSPPHNARKEMGPVEVPATGESGQRGRKLQQESS